MKDIVLKALIFGAVKPHQVDAVFDCVKNGITGYQAEKKYSLPPNTVKRQVDAVKLKISEYEAIYKQ